MPKQSREQIITELDARQIPYNETMGYNELAELLKQAPTAPMEPKKVMPPQPDEPIDYSKARCGLETIHDHERRIVLLERALVRLSNA